MTDQQVLRWIKENLSPFIREVLVKNISTPYTEDWLAAIVMRETGGLIAKYIPQNLKFDVVCSLMKGDYTMRSTEKEKQYHGFSFFQIDIWSYPDWIKTGDWKDPLKSCAKAISVLEEKRAYLWESGKLDKRDYDFDYQHRAITAAYNCGQGRVYQAIKTGADIDNYTTGRNYSKAVWGFRDIYKTLE